VGILRVTHISLIDTIKMAILPTFIHQISDFFHHALIALPIKPLLLEVRTWLLSMYQASARTAATDAVSTL
jgi:hypothetical protein